MSRRCVGRCKIWDWGEKNSLRATERNEAERRAFRRRVARLDRQRFLFVDEAGTHLAMTRRCARALRGQRATGSVPRNHGPILSIIGALGLRGLVAALSLEGAVDTAAFETFVTELLVPRLAPHDIVLLDHLKVHHASDIERAAATVKARVIWLPAYSPDLSPIENCWSKVKTFLRGRQPRTRAELDVGLTDALNSVTLADVAGWFKHCGY